MVDGKKMSKAKVNNFIAIYCQASPTYFLQPFWWTSSQNIYHLYGIQHINITLATSYLHGPLGTFILTGLSCQRSSDIGNYNYQILDPANRANTSHCIRGVLCDGLVAWSEHSTRWDCYRCCCCCCSCCCCHCCLTRPVSSSHAVV